MSYLQISFLFLAAIATLPNLCMRNSGSQLKPWTHRPLIEKNISVAVVRRDPLELYPKLAPQLNPNIRILGEATDDELENRCDYFALKRATGFAKPGTFSDRVDIVASCFHQTKNPLPNDIAAYTIDANSLSPLHFAVVKSVTQPQRESFLSKKPKPQITLQSKWGEFPYIFEHEPFDVPTCYGMACAFFTLNDEYKNQRP